jgi:predicted metal-dependent hydrolase
MFDNGEFDRTVASTRNLAVLYLFGYHLAEEIEHCAASLDVYEHLFKEQVWSEGVVGRTFDGSLHPTQFDVYNAAFTVARRAGVELSLSDLQDNPFSRHQRQAQFQTIKPGFHPDRNGVLARRAHHVETWDREWEPRLRKIIMDRLNA